jgi:hypothetical protein
VITVSISGLLIGTGVGIYPKGWDSPEVKQACGNTSKSSYYGKNFSRSLREDFQSSFQNNVLLCLHGIR